MKKYSALLALAALLCLLGVTQTQAGASGVSSLVTYGSYDELATAGQSGAAAYDLAAGQAGYESASATLTVLQWTEYVDSQGEWAARGQVRNNGSSTVFFAKISVDLQDKSTGKFYSNEFTYVNGSTAKTSGITTDTAIAPGETVTFDIRYTDAPASSVQAGTKTLSWETYGAQGLDAHPGITELTAYSYRGEWAAKGRVSNTGGATSYFTSVRSDMFDASGYYIGGDYTYVNGQNVSVPNTSINTDTAILAGNSASFDLKYTDVSWSSVASYKTKVNWSEYGSSKQVSSDSWNQYLAEEEQKAASDYYAVYGYTL